MTQDTLQPGRLQRLPSFTGVALLLALLASFPWLPITQDDASTGPRQLTIESSTNAVVMPALPPLNDDGSPRMPYIPVTPADWDYTIHIVGTREQYDTLDQTLNTTGRDTILIARQDENNYVLRVRHEMDEDRSRRGLSPVKVIDLRAVAAP